MSQNSPVGICGLGHYLPPHIMTNQAFVDRGMDTSPEWIETRTGIQTRHVATSSESTSDMATAAANKLYHPVIRPLMILILLLLLQQHLIIMVPINGVLGSK